MTIVPAQRGVTEEFRARLSLRWQIADAELDGTAVDATNGERSL